MDDNNALQPLRPFSFLAFALILGLVGLVNWRLPIAGRLAFAWVLTAGLIIVVMMLIGLQLGNRPDRLLIDSRNRVSLSRFQAAAWTVLVLSALVTAVAWNLHYAGMPAVAGAPHAHPPKPPAPFDPLAVVIDNNLLAAMGISATSLVATPALLNLKTRVQPSAADIQSATVTMGAAAEAPVGASGKLFKRADAQDASWVDMFRGEDVGNVDDADLSKVQQFLITLVLIAVYAAALFQAFATDATDGSPVKALPALSDNFIWLMGISHAGYLAYKVAPVTQTANTPKGGDSDPRTQPAG